MNRLGITNQSKNRQRHIQSLLNLGILGMTNPENPTTNNQRYKRVPQNRSLNQAKNNATRQHTVRTAGGSHFDSSLYFFCYSHNRFIIMSQR